MFGKDFSDFVEYYKLLYRKAGFYYKLKKYEKNLKKFYNDCIVNGVNPFSFLDFLFKKRSKYFCPWCIHYALASLEKKRYFNYYVDKKSVYEKKDELKQVFDEMYKKYVEQFSKMNISDIDERYFLLVRGNVSDEFLKSKKIIRGRRWI